MLIKRNLRYIVLIHAKYMPEPMKIFRFKLQNKIIQVSILICKIISPSSYFSNTLVSNTPVVHDVP